MPSAATPASPPDGDGTPSALAQLVGRRIRELRIARAWSLSSLAARAGLGKATLSEIESGRRNPTLETLYAIAAQLEIGLSQLLTEPDAESEPAAAISATVHGRAVEASLVTVYLDAAVTTEIYRLRIRPGRVQVSPGHGRGVTEHLFITTGAVSVGPVEATRVLAAGENWSWESIGPHSYAVVGDESAEAVLVMRHLRDGRLADRSEKLRESGQLPSSQPSGAASSSAASGPQDARG